MAAIQVLEDSHRNYIIKVTGAAIEADVLIVDVSALAIPCQTVRLDEVQYDVGPGNVVTIEWDATVDVTVVSLTEGPGQTLSFKRIGGIQNNAGAGVTGDVLLTTTSAAPYTVVLWFVKKSPVIPR